MFSQEFPFSPSHLKFSRYHELYFPKIFVMIYRRFEPFTWRRIIGGRSIGTTGLSPTTAPRLTKLCIKDAPFDAAAQREVCCLHGLKRRRTDMTHDVNGQWACTQSTVCPWRICHIEHET
ncbi:hypothetical protein XU18_2604 [Perkinsela sp. CCAP 1560/4]|nr:hypothetical protein XU18_2604 [Perkinsela sp. CCAP 1560/4]|eukprot:KNH06583.1 hypothetical protein XU18_2604 [Perkinsela sp. CCAP 1560/4]